MKKTLLILSITTLISQVTHPGQPAIQAIRNNQIQFIDCWFIDTLGNRKSVLIPSKQLSHALEKGLSFDGSSVDGCSKITKSDMLLELDIDSVRTVPWTNGPTKTAQVACNVFISEDTPFVSHPKYILQKTVEQAKELLGCEFLVGPELEFYMFKKTEKKAKPLQLADGLNYFSSAPDIATQTNHTTILKMLEMLDIDPEKLHHEVGPGQFEIPLVYDNVLKISDNLAIAKNALTTIANSSGLHISFMPKPFAQYNGSGMHIHGSLRSLADNSNAFYDGEREYMLSEVGRSFIAGILAHAKEMALLLNPTVNSYKRLVPGFEAPVYICASPINRSALVRIPQVSTSEPQAVRFELRCPDAMGNDDLKFAAMLAAGLDGIAKKLPLTLLSDNLYELTQDELTARGIETLPQSLEEAIAVFEASSFMKELLGDYLFNFLVKSKKEEALAYQRTISAWELERYQ